MKKVVFILVFTLSASISYAQVSDGGNARSGSIYSFFGAGTPVDIGSIEEESAGVFGISLKGFSSTGFANPAFFGQSLFTATTIGLSVSRFDARDVNGRSTNALVNPTSFLLSFPLYTGKLGVGVGLYQVTNSRFRVFQNGTVSKGDDANIGFSVNDRGSGGINKLEFGVGFKLTPSISLGYAPSYVFLSSSIESVLETDDPAVGDQVSFFNTDGQGFGNRFGLVYNKRDLLWANDALTFGATLTLPTKISSERVNQFDKFLGIDNEGFSIIETITIDEGEGLGRGDIELPLEYGAGFTYRPSPYTNFSVEGQVQKWSDTSFDFSPEQETFLKDRFRVGVGTQFHPYRKRSNRFLSKFKYGVGVNYDTGHLQINGQNIETLVFSTGLGILGRGRSGSALDLSFQYGIRGTRKNNLVKEDIWSFKLSLNLSELMFIRRRLQ